MFSRSLSFVLRRNWKEASKPHFHNCSVTRTWKEAEKSIIFQLAESPVASPLWPVTPPHLLLFGCSEKSSPSNLRQQQKSMKSAPSLSRRMSLLLALLSFFAQLGEEKHNNPPPSCLCAPWLFFTVHFHSRSRRCNKFAARGKRPAGLRVKADSGLQKSSIDVGVRVGWGASIKGLHKDRGPLLRRARSTKDLTFVCLDGGEGVWPRRGGGTGDGATMTERVDEVKSTRVTLFICGYLPFLGPPVQRAAVVFIYSTVSLLWWLHWSDSHQINAAGDGLDSIFFRFFSLTASQREK